METPSLESVKEVVISILITAGIVVVITLIVILVHPERRLRDECVKARGIYVSAAATCFDSSAVITTTRLPPK